MVRKLFCAMIVMTVAIGFVAADPIQVRILKVEGDDVTFQKTKKAEKGKKAENDGDPVTKSAAGAVVAKMKFNKEEKKIEVGEKVESGLKNEIFTKISEKGVGARINIEGDKITEILIFGGKKKKDTN